MAQEMWFVLIAATVISHQVPVAAMTARAEKMVAAPPSPLPTTSPPPYCPDKCGDVSIPYPFGIGEPCSWQGKYNVSCDDTFNPARPYLGNTEVVDISVESGEIRLRVPVASLCYDTLSDGRINTTNTTVTYRIELFLISAARNEFTAIGCDTLALLQGLSYYSGCISSCVSLGAAARDGDKCNGLGCCQTSIPENLDLIKTTIDSRQNTSSSPVRSFNPCSYAFVAEKGWYHFEQGDLQSSTFVRKLGNRNVTDVPVVLDWAIRADGFCPSPPEKDGVKGEATASACLSANSHCVNATHGFGYLCKCSNGYSGNPYITGGCRNINECKSSESNSCPSGSKCVDTEGSYTCPCKFGRRGNDCRPIFPAAAAAVLATTVASLLLAILLLSVHRDRKNQFKAACFNKNGGQILRAAGINMFTEKQLEKITNRYDTLIGEGAFGKVFKGTTDNKQLVAVKRSHKECNDLGKPANKNLQQGDDIVNEITFQFRNNHTNLVRLVGCCLETNIPVLVFEFISKGSLHNLLHDEPHEALRLPTRLNIAIGSAEALAHIHSSDGDYDRIHGDVKSANILLDDNLVPKVSDFGSSKILSVDMYARAVAADMSYIDPVYMKTERFVAKSDVYSFGVVLLELITRRTVKYGKNKINSLPIDFVKSCKEHNNAREMYDKDILSHGDGVQCQYCIECLDKIGDLAVRCLKEDVDERPRMAEVVDELKQAAKELADKCKQQ